MQNEPYVFTVLTWEAPGYFTLLESAEKHGWNLHTHFAPSGSKDRSNYDNIIARKHHLIREVLWLERPRTFLYVDGWDTKFIAPPDDMWWEGLHFSGQETCWPEEGYARYFPVGGKFPYLNSGVIWGETSSYLVRCPKDVGLDQLLWHREYLKSLKEPDYPISIDRDASFALTLFGCWDPADFSYISETKRWRYYPTFTQPRVIHAAGKSAMPGFF